MHKAKVADLHKAVREDRLEAAADTFNSVALRCALPSTGGGTIREGDGAVVERDDATVGDGDFEDLGGEVFKGRVSIGIGLAVHVPGGFWCRSPASVISCLKMAWEMGERALTGTKQWALEGSH
jgi:hypothetical protein